MTNKCNCGVCCNVSHCYHNVDGCKCGLKEINVYAGEQSEHHYCKSFKNK